jgi:predicted phage terminase large subunit-like protein
MKRILLTLLIIIMANILTPEQIKEARFKLDCYDDFYFFTKYCLGYKDLEIQPHRNLCNHIQRNQNNDLLILEPRGCFKTTIISVSYVIWRIIKNPDIKIFIAHKSGKKAKLILSSIRQHFERNNVFIYFFGDYIGDNWTKDSITVSKRKIIANEPTVSIGSIDTEETGGHYDIVIGDDLAGLDDMVSEAARKHTLNFFKTFEFIGEKAQRIIIGTRWHIDDLYNYIIETKKEYIVRIRQIFTKQGKSYFSQRWPLKKIRRIEEEDPFFFASQLLNDPLPDEHSIYNFDDLTLYENELYNYDEGINYGYADLAIKTKNKNDYSALVFGSKIEKIKIIDADILRAKPPVIENIIVNKCKVYNITKMGFEANSFQELYGDNIQKAIDAADLYTELVPITHTTDKHLRINSMYGQVTKKTEFRADWKTRYPLLVRQLVQFPGGKHDDGPDALEGLLSLYNNDADVNIRDL